jgi:hypothetical protein
MCCEVLEQEHQLSLPTTCFDNLREWNTLNGLALNRSYSIRFVGGARCPLTVFKQLDRLFFHTFENSRLDLRILRFYLKLKLPEQPVAVPTNATSTSPGALKDPSELALNFDVTDDDTTTQNDSHGFVATWDPPAVLAFSTDTCSLDTEPSFHNTTAPCSSMGDDTSTGSACSYNSWRLMDCTVSALLAAVFVARKLRGLLQGGRADTAEPAELPRPAPPAQAPADLPAQMPFTTGEESCLEACAAAPAATSLTSTEPVPTPDQVCISDPPADEYRPTTHEAGDQDDNVDEDGDEPPQAEDQRGTASSLLPDLPMLTGTSSPSSPHATDISETDDIAWRAFFDAHVYHKGGLDDEDLDAAEQEEGEEQLQEEQPPPQEATISPQKPALQHRHNRARWRRRRGQQNSQQWGNLLLDLQKQHTEQIIQIQLAQQAQHAQHTQQQQQQQQQQQ